MSELPHIEQGKQTAADHELTAAALRLTSALEHAGTALIEREPLVQLIALCAVAREHILVIGPPGTAKSEAVRRVSDALGGRYFEYLLGRFTEPSEIFGPIDLKRLQQGELVPRVDGMLPEAEVAFLDEVFLGSTAILNTLLGILNERVYRRGSAQIKCPLKVCVGAANSLPADSALSAFADRFLVTHFVEPILDARLEELLEAGWNGRAQTSSFDAHELGSMSDVELLAEKVRNADLSEVRPVLADALRVLRREGITLSDRRIVKTQRLIAAAGVLSGRHHPTAADLWPLIYVIPNLEGQQVARELLRADLERAQNSALKNAAEDASHGSIARAERIQTEALKLLEDPPRGAQLEDNSDISGAQEELTTEEKSALRSWRLRLEGVARELDAAFSPSMLSESLAALRERIVGALQR